MRRPSFIALAASGLLAASCAHVTTNDKNTSSNGDTDLRGEYGYNDKDMGAIDRSPIGVKQSVVKNDNGPKLSDYKPYKYELLFTDPVCGPYEYSQPVRSVGGKELKQKPKNVYCFNLKDRKNSGTRPTSPQYRLVEWIDNAANKEIYFTYLSFSNREVKDALCRAAQRGVKVRFTLDSTTDVVKANELQACSPEKIQYQLRGGQGGIGYGHNKIMMFYTDDPNFTRIIFSSGNMTSGPVVHHENWHYVTTSTKSHFAHMHKCVLDSMWNPETSKDRDSYLAAIHGCRASAPAPEESDIKAFFVPGEGVDQDAPVSGRSATNWMINGGNGTPGIKNASKIWIGCHRFFYGTMINQIRSRMTGKNKPELQIVADDDTYYKAVDSGYSTGDTAPEEWTNMEELAKLGGEVRLMETNPHERQLHHSKYLLFADGQGKFRSVLAGAANLTGSGFRTNFENIYFIMIPEVVDAFAAHHKMMFETMATKVEDLPEKGYVCDKLNPAQIPQDSCKQ